MINIHRICLFFAAVILASASCISAGTVTPGVSRGLAQQRKAAVSDVRYDLSMNICQTDSVKPDGEIAIHFDYQPDGEALQIDFAGEALRHLSVNGIDVASPVWCDGHVVIAPEMLKAGANTIIAEFTAADRALNRNPGYMYTLFVPHRAHSVFPCFDQPDIKASYRLTLTVPEQWKAVSNSPVVSSDNDTTGHVRTITFEPTEPLSTYLFAFAAGEFEYRQHTQDGRTIGAYYRETDPDRLAQLDEIFGQVESSLQQLEAYTGIPYPFAKYDLVIIPGFQFGGMEHTGATFYNDNTVFLGKSATGADQLRRATVIAHETSHMWFGDYVTMQWFDDVWTKEVFANYFAAQLTRQLLPGYDHDLEWLRVYMAAAIDQDRSDGSTPIRQTLDNMRNAGLIYNNIIYNKSPLMMAKLAEITGEESFRSGVRKYLNDYAYGNATWDNLVADFAEYTDADVEHFSRVWVYEAGMPHISFDVNDGRLTARQSDPRGRGIVWPQTFDVIVSDGTDTETLTVSFDGSSDTVEMPTAVSAGSPLILPTADGRAYGLLITGADNLSRLMADALSHDGIVSRLRPVGHMATLMMFNENYLAGNITTAAWLDFLTGSIRQCTDDQMLAALTRYVAPALLDLEADKAAPYERKLFDIVGSHPQTQGRTLILKTLISAARSPRSIAALYDIWDSGESPMLGVDDFNDMALQLAVAMPDRAGDIIARQRGRITDTDRLRRFDYVSRAAVSDTAALDALFESLNDPANRLVEPWTLSLLSLLNHPARHDHSVRYITPALEMLPQLQATGDIFFPANWATYLLSSYRSRQAADQVAGFIATHPDMNPLLLNKIHQAAVRLILKQR